MSAPPAERISVLIVDDHAVVRKGVRGYLEAQPDMTIAGEAASGEKAVHLAAEQKPDVILMDLIMPGMDGVEATRRTREVSPDSQVIVLTSFHEDEHIFPAIKAGALSYLLKNVRPEELAAAVRAAAKGEAVLDSPVATRVVEEMWESLHTEEPATPQPEAQPLDDARAGVPARRHLAAPLVHDARDAAAQRGAGEDLDLVTGPVGGQRETVGERAPGVDPDTPARFAHSFRGRSPAPGSRGPPCGSHRCRPRCACPRQT